MQIAEQMHIAEKLFVLKVNASENKLMSSTHLLEIGWHENDYFFL